MKPNGKIFSISLTALCRFLNLHQEDVSLYSDHIKEELHLKVRSDKPKVSIRGIEYTLPRILEGQHLPIESISLDTSSINPSYLICDHKFTGGNDYLICTKCGFEYAYARLKYDKAIIEYIKEQLGLPFIEYRP